MTAHRVDPDADVLLAELTRVVERRIALTGVSERAVCRDAGVGSATLSRLLNGHCRLDLDNFAALARWAGLRIILAPREGVAVDGGDAGC